MGPGCQIPLLRGGVSADWGCPDDLGIPVQLISPGFDRVSGL
jgi:hypothetical protein